MSTCRDVDRAAEHWDWGQVLRWCEVETRRVLGSGSSADDAAQEAALRAWRRHHQCRSVPGRRAWVAMIARNEALRIVAGTRPEESISDQAELPSSGGVGMDTAERLDVWRALDGLGPEERELVGLRYWMDLTQAEAARRLGVPEGTAKVRLHRVRSTLREQLVAA
ncbi:MAG: sigma-70 family polymerase sigma factor [Solirubrobacterales bacterium]|jgi:RNA polymerase sigma-70 factor (ECF subfamily)|nr:sigma-70 family polymerase sigma factor [Solirubrobacterales bacterium]